MPDPMDRVRRDAAISSALRPVKNDMQEMKERIVQLTQRVARVETWLAKAGFDPEANSDESAT